MVHVESWTQQKITNESRGKTSWVTFDLSSYDLSNPYWAYDGNLRARHENIDPGPPHVLTNQSTFGISWESPIAQTQGQDSLFPNQYWWVNVLGVRGCKEDKNNTPLPSMFSDHTGWSGRGGGSFGQTKSLPPYGSNGMQDGTPDWWAQNY